VNKEFLRQLVIIFYSKEFGNESEDVTITNTAYMGVGSGEAWHPWIFKHGIFRSFLLFFSLFLAIFWFFSVVPLEVA